jgi:hypothetical protein
MTKRRDAGETFTHARDADDLAQKIKDTHLTCRVDSHSRYVTSYAPVADNDYADAVLIKTLHCRNRCGVTWTQVLDKNGHVLWETGASYTKAKGYLVRGVGRLKREDRDRLRLEQAQRWIEKHATE